MKPTIHQTERVVTLRLSKKDAHNLAFLLRTNVSIPELFSSKNQSVILAVMNDVRNALEPAVNPAERWEVKS